MMIYIISKTRKYMTYNGTGSSNKWMINKCNGEIPP